MRDFAVWLNPSSLSAFNKLEVMRLGGRLIKSKTKEIPTEIQEELSRGLANCEKDLGIFVLRLYFYQIINLEFFSIDLRRNRFHFQNDHWHYNSKHLGFGFNEDLRSALFETYDYYYVERKGNLIDALIRMGLVQPNWHDTHKKEVESAFIKHFKGADSKRQKFTMRDLIKSFTEIFTIIRDKGGKVPSEFSMLGVYLTSMYLTLDKIDESFDVEACYLFARQWHDQSLSV